MQAETMHFSITGIASGTFNGTAFSDKRVTATTTYDTADVMIGSTVSSDNDALVTYTIEGLGSYDAVGGHGIYVLPGMGVVGTTNSGWAYGEALQGDPAGLTGYDLTTALTNYTGDYMPGELDITTGGVLQIDSLTDATANITSAATPEPSSVALLGIGGVSFLAMMRRRLARNA